MPDGAVGGPIDYGYHSFFRGSKWYTHIVRPNRATCLNGNANYQLAGFTVNSLYVGGVHVLMADGAVRFVSDNVARNVWRGMGTRNGHETFALP